MFAIVIGKYNEDEDSLENVSRIDDKVFEYILSGAKIEKAYVIPAGYYPYLSYVRDVAPDIDEEEKAIVFEIKRGKTTSHCILIPVRES